MKTNRKTERWMLLIAFAACTITGIGLHLAGHGPDHSVWHNWAVAHVIASVAWLIGTIIHIKRHWPWYRQLFSRGIGKKSKVTVFLTAVFLIVVATGVILLAGVDGANSPIGLWHYKIGLLLMVLSIIHVLGRWKFFRITGGKNR